MPDELILTPGGFKPRANVHHVPRDHVLRMDGRNVNLMARSGQLIRSIGSIAQRPGPEPLLPRNLSLSARPPRSAAPAPFAQVDGWVAYTGWSNSSGAPISSFSTSWLVPAEPATKGSQTIFLFNGIQNSTMIYQPVLQWGSSAAGGGQYWAVASWYADGRTGHSFYSDLVRVNVGDNLTGIMTLTGQNAAGTAFDYNCEFQGNQRHNADHQRG